VKRIKRRYLALQIDTDKEPSRRELVDAIWGAIVKLYGEYGASQANLTLINYDLETKIAVIRTSLEALNLVRTSLSSITSIAGDEAVLHVVAVSGTIKALLTKLSR
jgi:ribonuclease P/MRP protein subunit POP5